MNINDVVRHGKALVGEKTSRGREYMDWLDTEPKVFLSFREWMNTYYPDEVQ
jgi:hypothetical protein